MGITNFKTTIVKRLNIFVSTAQCTLYNYDLPKKKLSNFVDEIMIFKGAVHTTLQIITVKYSACCSVTFKFVSSLLFLAFIVKNLEYFLS